MRPFRRGLLLTSASFMASLVHTARLRCQQSEPADRSTHKATQFRPQRDDDFWECEEFFSDSQSGGSWEWMAETSAVMFL